MIPYIHFPNYYTSKAHLELTTSQSKKYLKFLTTQVKDLLRKVGFLERRQQRQNPSLAEISREAQMSSETWGGLFCCFIEGCHAYLMLNPLWGFFLCPCHFVCLVCSCMWYNCTSCCCPKRRKVEELEEVIVKLQERVKVIEEFEEGEAA